MEENQGKKKKNTNLYYSKEIGNTYITYNPHFHSLNSHGLRETGPNHTAHTLRKPMIVATFLVIFVNL